ncbi:MAG: hypothetical protein DI537_32915 [Stutzerimonas stutzeri]|nr:MAG: hypothetical protein DI537_32915 [Stutzerimonas stutzeri]
MDRILAPRARIATPSGGPHPSAIVSWPVTLTATICRLDGSECHSDIQREISSWLSKRHDIQIDPGLSLQRICDDQTVVSAVFATKTEKGWSVRCGSGGVSFDVTLLSGQAGSQLSVDFSSELICTSAIDILDYLSQKFIVVRDGVQLHARPQLASIKTMPRLIEFIETPTRKLPVVVISLDENERRIATAAVDPFVLSKKLVGVAHVVVVPGDETYLLSTRFGKELSAYRRSIRVYGPGFSLTGEGARQTGRIIPFDNKDDEALLIETCRTAVRLLGRREQHVGFDDIYALDSHMRSMPTSAALDLTESLHLRQRIAELEAALEKRTAALQIADARVAKLSKCQAQSGSETPKYRSVAEVCELAAAEFAGQIDIPKKAIKSAKGSALKDLDTLKSALRILACEYRKMRVDGGKEAVRALEDALASLHLEAAPVAPRTMDGQKGKLSLEGGGGRLIADHNLRNKGNPNDSTKCIRIYFAWDESRKIPVVASLPGYLG